MQWIDTEPATTIEQLPPPKASDDPLFSKLDIAKHEMEEAKARLAAQLKQMELTEEHAGLRQTELAKVAGRRRLLEAEHQAQVDAAAQRDAKVRLASFTAEEARKQTKKLLEEIKKLEASVPAGKQLKYHAPLSRTVHSEEIFFECQNGRVSFIDLPAFLQEVKQSMEGIARELRTQPKVERATAPVGPYRLRFAVERDRSFGSHGDGFRYGLSSWVVEPQAPQRGETLDQALSAKSEFRQLVDNLDGNLTVVTFWVYPDSFETFRQLRDYLYERGLDVAGRPLPPGAPIAASKNGTASRGQ